MRRIHSIALTFAIASTLVTLAACRDHRGVTDPVPGASLDPMWPNDDGRFWNYRLLSHVAPGGPPAAEFVFATPAAVPPAPSLATLARHLDDLLPDAFASTDTVSYSLSFAGEITTLSGVTAQNLQVSVGPPIGTARSTGAGLSTFYDELVRARPDLRARIAAAGLVRPSGAGGFNEGPLFVHGYAWQKTTSFIGTYGDLDTLLAWKFLDANLSRGAEFSFQLLPSLTSDLRLHGRVLGRRTVTTPSGTYVGALDVLYLVDYGTTAFTNDQGGIDGYGRDVSLGRVAYAAGVGPVTSRESHLLLVGANATLSAPGGSVGLSVMSTGLPVGMAALRR